MVPSYELKVGIAAWCHDRPRHVAGKTLAKLFCPSLPGLQRPQTTPDRVLIFPKIQTRYPGKDDSLSTAAWTPPRFDKIAGLPIRPFSALVGFC